MRWLVTGYGPFEDVVDNVSARVAAGLGGTFEILEVSYAAVDEFISGLDPASFDAWLALGHAKSETRLRVETLGRNEICMRPDVRGEGRLGTPIRDGASNLRATLWDGIDLEGGDWFLSDNAGGYLCNYVLYRGLETFPDRLVGFIHLPPAEAMTVEDQISGVRALMAKAEVQEVRR